VQASLSRSWICLAVTGYIINTLISLSFLLLITITVVLDVIIFLSNISFQRVQISFFLVVDNTADGSLCAIIPQNTINHFVLHTWRTKKTLFNRLY